MNFLSCCSDFSIRCGDAFAFLVLCRVRAGGDFRHDGRDQSCPWRIHHVRRLRDCRRPRASGCRCRCDPVRGAGRRNGRASLSSALVVRQLYGRPMDTIVATWGLSLIATQGTLIVLGLQHVGHRHPAGQLHGRGLFILDLSPGADGRAQCGAGRALSASSMRTRFGMLARATIQVPHMAEALGSDTRFVYSMTFGLGAALAGGRRAVRTDHDDGADHGRHVHRGGVRHGRGRRGGRVPRHRARRRLARAGQGHHDLMGGQLFGQIGLLVAVILVIRVLPEGYLRQDPPRAGLARIAQRNRNPVARAWAMLEGPQTLGRGRSSGPACRSWSRSQLAIPLVADGYT